MWSMNELSYGHKQYKKQVSCLKCDKHFQSEDSRFNKLCLKCKDANTLVMIGNIPSGNFRRTNTGRKVLT